MSEARWCNIGNHAFNLDAGLISQNVASRIPDSTSPSGFRVTQRTDECCIPCNERLQEAAEALRQAPAAIEPPSTLPADETRTACVRKNCTRWAMPGKKLCKPHRDDFMGAR